MVSSQLDCLRVKAHAHARFKWAITECFGYTPSKTTGSNIAGCKSWPGFRNRAAPDEFILPVSFVFHSHVSGPSIWDCSYFSNLGSVCLQSDVCFNLRQLKATSWSGNVHFVQTRVYEYLFGAKTSGQKPRFLVLPVKHKPEKLNGTSVETPGKDRDQKSNEAGKIAKLGIAVSLSKSFESHSFQFVLLQQDANICGSVQVQGFCLYVSAAEYLYWGLGGSNGTFYWTFLDTRCTSTRFQSLNYDGETRSPLTNREAIYDHSYCASSFSPSSTGWPTNVLHTSKSQANMAKLGY